MDAADALLPLTANGQPALPADTAECQQAEVQAMVLAATASYMAPAALCWEGQMQDRLGCYVRRRFNLAGDSDDAYLPAMQPLGGLLLEFCHDSIRFSDPLLVMAALSRASAALATQSIRDAVRRQLQQARQGTPHPLLQTADQLEAALQAKLLSIAISVPRTEAEEAQPWLMPQAGSIRRFLNSGSERLLQLDRRNPKALIAVAAAKMASDSYLPPRRDAVSNVALLPECTA